MTIVEIPFANDVMAALRLSPSELASEIRLAAAIRWYAQGRISQGRAAEIAGITRAEFIDAVAASGLAVCQMTITELEDELRRA